MTFTPLWQSAKDIVKGIRSLIDSEQTRRLMEEPKGWQQVEQLY